MTITVIICNKEGNVIGTIIKKETKENSYPKTNHWLKKIYNLNILKEFYFRY